MKPVLTEDGKSVQVDDAGLPLYVNDDGEQVGVNVSRQFETIRAANKEAEERRGWLSEIAGKMGFSGDTRKRVESEKLIQLLEGYATDSQELTGLRAAKSAGKLDDTAPAKIKAMAAKMRTDEIEAALTDAKLARTESAASEQAALTAVRDLNMGMVRQGLSELWQRCKNAKGENAGKGPQFQGNTPEPYIQAVTNAADGTRVRWTGKFDPETASPELVFVDAETGETTVKGPDGIENLTLTRHALSVLPKTWPILFVASNGNSGASNFGKAGPEDVAKKSTADFDAEARAALAG